MLKDHKPIDLEAGQEITVVSVGDAYDTWEGYKDPSTGMVCDTHAHTHTRSTPQAMSEWPAGMVSHTHTDTLLPSTS